MLTLLIDDGGVMSDNSLRAPQWQRLVGQYLAPRLGSTPEAWAAANVTVIQSFFAPGAWQARQLKYNDYITFQYDYNLEWLTSMCTILGIPSPPPDQAVALAEETYAWILPQVNAPIPCSPETIRHLHSLGHTLYTASGESEADLRAYTTTYNTNHCFTRLYGTDIINTLKSGPLFYTRLFHHASIDPANALILDDSPFAVAWAIEAGARAILISSTNHDPGAPYPILPSLSHLPPYLTNL